ncbi:putative NADH-flavin reductase [Novosphingobium chloroacetimidivorans]|uniref:Putative NADH-flavin reductase n=1 Tax=Novosphingobium chloroacetimidivorans TaxID=1428314 RepID=A0A7W7NXB0_9SPHN|nr:putative NADH-flavin reductase [Novosphingobium chloroacetimidivorans]
MTNPVFGKRSKVRVLGALGGAGQLIVQEAQARGYNVAALVRSPEMADGLIRRRG